MDSKITDYRVMLAKHLGPDNYSKYLETLQDMFGQKITKETFDGLVSTFLVGDALVLHNLMMLAILKMCGEDIKKAPVVEYEIKEKPRLLEVKQEKLEVVRYRKEKSPMPAVISSNTTNVIAIHRKFGEKSELHLPEITIANRFPNQFMGSLTKLRPGLVVPRNHIPDVTHLYEIDDLIDENDSMSDYFAAPKPGQPYTSHNSTYYGKCLLKAWKLGCQNVDISAIEAAADSTYEHIKEIIRAMIRQRKPYTRYEPKMNSSFFMIGNSYPNPYLRQGHHAYESFNRPEILTCGETMHVPDHISSTDEKERLAILRDAAQCPVPDPSPYQRKVLTVSELYGAIRENGNLIPNAKHRTELVTQILGKLNSGGKMRPSKLPSYMTTKNKFDPEEVEENLTDEEEGEILPTYSY